MMIKKLMTGLVLTASVAAFSQVGIGTVNPHTSADLDLGSNNKALYLNRVANTAAVANPQEGMVIYDLESKCVKAYQGNPAKWSDCLNGSSGSGTGTVTALNCSTGSFSPQSGTAGQEYSGTLTVSYTGGNGGTYPTNHFTLNGLTFFLPAGNFATGNGNLVYQIIGTPAAAGTTPVEIAIGGQNCSGANALLFQVNAAPNNPVGVLPSSITFTQNKKYFIASIYDTDYLPYNAPTGPASTAAAAADGVADTPVLNIPGTITTAGFTVQIPVASVSGSGNINAWSNIITIPASMTQDGISRQVELSWASQAYTTATTYITATIKAIGGTLNVKQLDLNAGIGSDFLGVLMGTFQYPYNSTGSLTTYELRDIPGIPDRMFGLTDNTPAQGQRHNFLYMPVMGEDGKIWLNNNLGAHYNNISHASFNPMKQAASHTDHLAFGSLFQWGRKPDGHELITWTSATAATPVSATTAYSAAVTDPTHSLFILGKGSSPYQYVWRGTYETNLWAAETSANNPCPKGFRVAKAVEIDYWAASVRQLKGTEQYKGFDAIDTALRFPRSGSRQVTGGMYYTNSASVHYWTSNGMNPFNALYGTAVYMPNPGSSGTELFGNGNTSSGYSVRCIQN